ncbi:hypothetical protein BaRGS_00032501 [Batillaria attramentaria]|uniref:CB1 cannabinoid receptor-interacting protein 1 n=1 Tax=Batillaria attramentaria TaxID=370345 RepID=A0ABD0JMH7_9CAEN
MASHFDTSLELRSKRGSKPVFYKHDGTRFSNSVTIKLCVGQTYTMYVYFRPSLVLEKWLIQSERVNFSQVQLPRKWVKEDASVFSADWSTEHFKVSKKGQREEIALHFELERGLILNTSIQVKFYTGDNHATWGQPMHALELSCDSPAQGQTNVNVRRGSIV